MKVIGLIAEYNPFHNGHLYQINKIKEKYPDSIIIVVVSSYFTERGDISILNKWDKTKIALENNIDLVVELPFVYATQASDIFAKGAVTILNKLKIDTLVFGTEREDISSLLKGAKYQLEGKDYNDRVKKYLNEGLNYPTATSKALNDFINIKIDSPNDLLALSYIKEVLKQNKNIEIDNIKRTVDYHNGIKGSIASATTIRNKYLNNEEIDNLIPYNKELLYKINMNSTFPYLKYKLLEDDNLSKYQDVDEGIENRIIKYLNTSNSYEELIKNIKTKRYTYNKISRLLLHILVGFTKEQNKDIDIDYIRILGFNKEGKKYLSKIKKEIDIPIITGYKKNISKILDMELKVSKIYSLIVGESLEEKEYQKKPIIK